TAGPALVAGVAALVVAAIAAGFAIGRLLRLPARMALLVACGNAICGNSAIAAVAPVIAADADDVAVSIAFTAALGIAVMVLLPLAGLAVGLDRAGFGVLAGLTVYAVPQVAAAAAPFGAIAVQIGMVVKLVRVAMLGPVCLALSLVRPGRAPSAGAASRPPLLPWFVLGFAATAA
ncbi:putative sulfate exporter family transporter, partial [Oharaeibacter diazotrophicus]